MNTSQPSDREPRTFAHSFDVAQLIPPWAWAVVGFILLPVMGWSSVSITILTHALGIPWWCAWIPAASTDGVMLLTTPWAVNELLDPEVRIWAGSVATTGIVGSVVCGFVEHFLDPSPTQKIGSPLLAGGVGAIPPLMAAVVVHIIFMILRQQNRMRRDAGQKRSDAEQAERDLAAAERNRVAAKATADAEHAESLRRAAELLQIAERTRKTNQEALAAEQEKDRIRTQRSAAVEQALSRPVPLRDVSAPKQVAKPKAAAGGGRRSDKADNARRYLIRQLRDEKRDPGSITAAEVDRAIGAVSGANNKPTGYSNRNLAGWLTEVQAFLEQTA